MRKNGRPEEKRLHCHGQGYDLVERPLIRNDEPMNIENDMNIVVHPTYIEGGMLSWFCDNWLIGPTGRASGCTISRKRSPNSASGRAAVWTSLTLPLFAAALRQKTVIGSLSSHPHMRFADCERL